MPPFKSIFATLAAAFSMITLAVLCAFLSMRIAIHGSEVEVPNLAGRSDEDAARIARDLGLNLSVENRFYSPAVAPNHILSQSPGSGSRVRRGWQVRVTESLGPQNTSVPDITGITERPATLMLKRIQLEVGTVAHLPAPAPAGVVLAQSPPPNSKGINGPTVSLLVTDQGYVEAPPAYIMPSIVGQTLATASYRLGTAGLHITTAQPPQEVSPDSPDRATAVPEQSSTGPSDPAVPAYVAPQVINLSSIVTSQTPPPGRRVTKADTIRVTLGHPAEPTHPQPVP